MSWYAQYHDVSAGDVSQRRQVRRYVRVCGEVLTRDPGAGDVRQRMQPQAVRGAREQEQDEQQRERGEDHDVFGYDAVERRWGVGAAFIRRRACKHYLPTFILASVEVRGTLIDPAQH